MKRKEFEPDYKVGDVIGFSGRNWGSACINIGTYGIPCRGISHVGIIGRDLGRWDSKYGLHLFESVAKKGTRSITIREAIFNYDGRVWHYPLYRKLYPHEYWRLRYFLLEGLGKPYDKIGAFRSGGIGLSWVESLFREEDLASVFCSEWIAAAFAVTGLYPIVNASRWNPNRLIRRLRRHRVLKRPVRKK